MRNTKILGLMILLAFPAATLCAQNKSSKPPIDNKLVGPTKTKRGMAERMGRPRNRPPKIPIISSVQKMS